MPAAEPLDPDARSRVWRVDEASVADIEADVAEAEEKKIAGPYSSARNVTSLGELRDGVVRQCDPEVAVDEGHEAGAVEAGAWRHAAVEVADADELSRVPRDLISDLDARLPLRRGVPGLRAEAGERQHEENED